MLYTGVFIIMLLVPINFGRILLSGSFLNTSDIPPNSTFDLDIPCRLTAFPNTASPAVFHNSSLAAVISSLVNFVIACDFQTF